jgi:hypothetical protein
MAKRISGAYKLVAPQCSERHIVSYLNKVFSCTKMQTTVIWMAAYEVESADLEFVYRINYDKFHRIWMV